MASFEFTVYTSPRPKKRPKVYRWSTVNPSEKDEKLLAGKIKSLSNCPKKPLAGQISVDFKFYINPPKSTPKWQLPIMEQAILRPNKSPDLDNYVKLILDSLNGILWEDDRYIIEINSAKYYTTDQEKIEIKMQQTNISKYRKDYLETK